MESDFRWILRVGRAWFILSAGLFAISVLLLALLYLWPGLIMLHAPQLLWSEVDTPDSWAMALDRYIRLIDYVAMAGCICGTIGLLKAPGTGS